MDSPEPTPPRARPVQVSAITEVELHKLRWYPRRGHLVCSDQEYEALLFSIAEHGLQEPILLDMTRTILDGHARYQAAIDLGLKSIPVRVVWHLSSREEYLVAMHGPDCPELRPTGLWDLLQSLRPAPCVTSTVVPDAPSQDGAVLEDLPGENGHADTGAENEAACHPVEVQPEPVEPTSCAVRRCFVPRAAAPDTCCIARQAAGTPRTRSWRISSRRVCAPVGTRSARILGPPTAEDEAHWSVVHPQRASRGR